MKIPLKIARGLQALMQGESIPQSELKGDIIEVMISEGLIQRKLQGRTKSMLCVVNVEALATYIQNRLGIPHIPDYITGYGNNELTRSGAIEIASDSKIKSIRTFKGFLVNCYAPVVATLNNEPLIIHPATGTFTFIYDFENFIPPPNVTLVGVENPENFRHIDKQQRYFAHLHPMFISRYPQGKDLVKWLNKIPNPYLHFGDFDLEGVKIYLNEYKKHLGDRAAFFVPGNLEKLLQSYGNAELYDKQYSHRADPNVVTEENIRQLLSVIHANKKVLEQEILITR
jgi:hypothetical protein